MLLKRNKACAPVRNSSLSSRVSILPFIKAYKTWTRVQRDSQAQGNVSIPVIVVLLKHVRHALQADAGLHKQVEAHVVVAAPVVRAVQQAHELRREAVPESDKGFAKLVVGYAAGVVGVEAVEESAPGG
jgi:hypothetical protein